MGDNKRIDQLAGRQHGVFSASQARAAGFDKHAVARKLASADWRQFDYRVFGLASASPTWERQLWVAILSRPQAVVGGRAAAHLHGFRGFGRVRPVILVPGSSNARSRVARVIRAEYFDELETVRVRGFPVTSKSETLMTLAGDLPLQALETLFDDLLLSGSVDINDLDLLLERDRGRRRRGIVSLRALSEDRKPGAPAHDSSYLEAMLQGLLAKVALPSWTREYPFSLGEVPSRVDFYIPAWRLVIEADGRNWHARVADFETDRKRDNELAMKGIQVIRFTYRMLKSDRNGCIETILAVGRVRSA